MDGEYISYHITSHAEADSSWMYCSPCESIDISMLFGCICGDMLGCKELLRPPSVVGGFAPRTLKAAGECGPDQ